MNLHGDADNDEDYDDDFEKIKMYDKVRAAIRCQLMSPDNVNIYVLITRNEMISIL